HLAGRRCPACTPGHDEEYAGDAGRLNALGEEARGEPLLGQEAVLHREHASATCLRHRPAPRPGRPPARAAGHRERQATTYTLRREATRDLAPREPASGAIATQRARS